MLQAPKISKFIQKVRAERASLIYLIHGKQNGKPAWIYAMIRKSMADVFEHKLQLPSIDVAVYGKVLYSGWGDMPPDTVVNAIKREYFQ